MNNILTKIFNEIKVILKRSFSIYFELLKLIVPITILVKVLSELGLVSVIGAWLRPVMNLVGLPGEMGLVWATGLVTNPYGAIITYSEISKTAPVTLAQVTILSSMILIAHNMIVEVSIGKKIGVSIIFQIVLRLFSAFIFGLILNQIYQFIPSFQVPAVSIWTSNMQSETLLSWLLSTLENYLMMYIIMTSLITILHTLEKLNLLEWIYTISEPLLNFFGMSKKAAPIAIIGMTLGLSVGGGLIIEEARNGSLSKKDIFLVLSLMCLLHSLFEDTIVMTTIGASLSGILLGRLIFTFVFFYIISHSRWIEKVFIQEHQQIVPLEI
jgi:hypothetical protein